MSDIIKLIIQARTLIKSGKTREGAELLLKIVKMKDVPMRLKLNALGALLGTTLTLDQVIGVLMDLMRDPNLSYEDALMISRKFIEFGRKEELLSSLKEKVNNPKYPRYQRLMAIRLLKRYLSEEEFKNFIYDLLRDLDNFDFPLVFSFLLDEGEKAIVARVLKEKFLKTEDLREMVKTLEYLYQLEGEVVLNLISDKLKGPFNYEYKLSLIIYLLTLAKFENVKDILINTLVSPEISDSFKVMTILTIGLLISEEVARELASAFLNSILKVNPFLAAVYWRALSSLGLQLNLSEEIERTINERIKSRRGSYSDLLVDLLTSWILEGGRFPIDKIQIDPNYDFFEELQLWISDRELGATASSESLNKLLVMLSSIKPVPCTEYRVKTSEVSGVEPTSGTPLEEPDVKTGDITAELTSAEVPPQGGAQDQALSKGEDEIGIVHPEESSSLQELPEIEFQALEQTVEPEAVEPTLDVNFQQGLTGSGPELSAEVDTQLKAEDTKAESEVQAQVLKPEEEVLTEVPQTSQESQEGVPLEEITAEALEDEELQEIYKEIEKELGPVDVDLFGEEPQLQEELQEMELGLPREDFSEGTELDFQETLKRFWAFVNAFNMEGASKVFEEILSYEPRNETEREGKLDVINFYLQRGYLQEDHINRIMDEILSLRSDPSYLAQLGKIVKEVGYGDTLLTKLKDKVLMETDKELRGKAMLVLYRIFPEETKDLLPSLMKQLPKEVAVEIVQWLLVDENFKDEWQNLLKTIADDSEIDFDLKMALLEYSRDNKIVPVALLNDIALDMVRLKPVKSDEILRFITSLDTRNYEGG